MPAKKAATKTKLDKTKDESRKTILTHRENQVPLCNSRITLSDGRILVCERWEHKPQLGDLDYDSTNKHEAWYRGSQYDWGGKFDDPPERMGLGYMSHHSSDGTTPVKLLCHRDLDKLIRVSRGMMTWEGKLRGVRHVTSDLELGTSAGVGLTIASLYEPEDVIEEYFERDHPIKFPVSA